MHPQRHSLSPLLIQRVPLCVYPQLVSPRCTQGGVHSTRKNTLTCIRLGSNLLSNLSFRVTFFAARISEVSNNGIRKPYLNRNSCRSLVFEKIVKTQQTTLFLFTCITLVGSTTTERPTRSHASRARKRSTRHASPNTGLIAILARYRTSFFLV